MPSSSPSPSSRAGTGALDLPTRSDITLQLARGLELVRKHHWAHAVVALTSALELDPYEPKALESRARCNMMLGQMATALEDAERLVKVDKRRNELYAEHVAIEREKKQEILMRQQQKQIASMNKNNPSRHKSLSQENNNNNDDDNHNEDQDAGGLNKSPHVRFVGLAKGVIAANKLNNNKKHNAGETDSSHHSPSKSLDMDDLLSPTSKRLLSPSQKIELEHRLAKPTGSSIQRNRVYYDHSQVVGGGGSSTNENRLFGDVSDDENDNEIVRQQQQQQQQQRGIMSMNVKSLSASISSPLPRPDELVENYSPSVSMRRSSSASPSSPSRSKQQQSLSLSGAVTNPASPSRRSFGNKNSSSSGGAGGGDPTQSAGNPRGLAAETAQKFSLKIGHSSASKQQQLNSATAGGNSDDLLDDGTVHHNHLSPSGNNSKDHHHHRNKINQNTVSGRIEALSIEDPNKVRTKYYQGILLRAQVLFAMGCFEDACRQFHEGLKLRPDVDEFRTGVNETEHILLGAVHPWRKRIAKTPAEDIAALRSNTVSPGSLPSAPTSRPTSAKNRGTGGGSPSTSINKNENENEKDGNKVMKSKNNKKRWVPPKKDLSSQDRDVLQCMPENSKDFFFLRQLRNHPRIFSTGLGPGIVRGMGSNNNQGGSLSAGTTSSSTQIIFGKGGPRVGGRGSSRAGVGGRFANANDNQDYFLKNAEGSAGPAQLAAFCAATAIESAEEEAMMQQNAILLTQAETATERAENERKKKQQQSGGSGGTDDHSNKNSTSTGTATKAHGMFGNQPLLDDDEHAKKRRDFHIRPPDTRSWGVQSARGRRRIKDAVDTTLKYLQTQQNFWAHRDERTSIPMLDEPDLPPRFRPDHKFDSYFTNQKQQENDSYFLDSSSLNNNNSKSLTQRPLTAGAKQHRVLNKIPIRPVTTASAENERVEIEEERKRKRRASMAAVNAVHQTIHDEQRRKEQQQHEQELAAVREANDRKMKANENTSTSSQNPNYTTKNRSAVTNHELSLLSFSQNSAVYNDDDGDNNDENNDDHRTKNSRKQKVKVSSIPKVVSKNSSEQEGDFMSDMHEVFKLMADQHNMKHDTAEQSEIQFHRNQRNYQNYLANSVGRSRHQNHSNTNNAPKITSPEFTFIPRTNRDEVSAHVLAIPSNDASVGSPAPVFVSENLRNIHQDIQQALSKGQAEVYFSEQGGGAGGGSGHQQQHGHRKQGMNSNKSSSGHHDSTTTNKQQQGTSGDDLARIQRSLFESGDEPYHRRASIAGGASANNNNNRNASQQHASMSSLSPQRAVTLRWGEYDGLHMVDGNNVNINNKNRRHSLADQHQHHQSLVKKHHHHHHLSPADQAIERKHQARQFARHQRARGLLAQNIQKELGVELPYEAIFRVPERPIGERQERRRKSLSSMNLNSVGTSNNLNSTSLELFQPFSDVETNHNDDGHQSTRNKNNNISPPPLQFTDGRDYATVSIKASPPQRPWNLKPDAVLDETREQEIARIDAEQKQQEREAKAIKKERKKRRRIKRQREKEKQERNEHEENLDHHHQQPEDRPFSANSNYSSNHNNEDRDEEEDGEEDTFEDLSSDHTSDLESDNEQDFVVDENGGELENKKRPPLTLDQVRSQYSRTARQRLRRRQSHQSSHALLNSPLGGGAGGGSSGRANSMMRSRGGKSMMVGFSSSGAALSGRSSSAPSDDDHDHDDSFDDTSSSDDEDEDYMDDEMDQQQQQLGEDSSQFLRQTSSRDNYFESRLEDESANIAEAVSAAKALLEQSRREETRSTTPYFGFRPQTPQQQQKETSSSKQQQQQQQNSQATTFSSFVITNKHESAAMKRLNATLRNISRLCSLGDVPLAIATAAALVKELEAADSSLSGSGGGGHHQRQKNYSSSGSPSSGSSPSSHHYDQPNSVAAAFTSLAARLRCTLGALYLEIGEGPAAVGELSRAVLLAKKSQQSDVYEQAVKLLGECYQTSGEEVDSAFEASSQPRRKRATSIVRV